MGRGPHLGVAARLVPLALALILAAAPMGLLAVPGPALARRAPQNGPSEADTLVLDLVTIDQEIKDTNAKIGELEGRSDALADKIDGIESEVESNRDRLTVKRQALAVRIRKMYVTGRMSNIEMLFSSKDFSDFIRCSEVLQEVTDNDAKLVASVKAEADKLDSALAELKAGKAEVDSVLADLKAREKRLSDTKAERQALLSKAGSDAGPVEARSTQVETKIEESNPPTSGPVNHTGRFVTMVATGYSPEEPGLDDTTATGLRAQHGVVAVDPSFIPLGTRLYIEGYGAAIAGDTGSAIKGNRIDLCFDTLEECNAYGRHTITVEILD